MLRPLDWGITLTVLAFLFASVLASRTYMRSVADFLAAGRTGGRYLITVSAGMGALGAITIIGSLEMNLVAGFSMNWWGMTMGVILLLITLSGWVIYRFRRTRCLTLAQFFELRYSRGFRIYTGLIAFFAGIVNMGIFPAVEARFFMYFCGLPPVIHLLGIGISTFALTMAILLGIALFFVFSGGLVVVMITDFLQGVFVNFGLIAIVLFFLFTVDWKTIEEALRGAPAHASLINPYHTSHVKDFNLWYFLIGVFGVLYGTMSWQGTQAYNSSAENAHEAKMAGVLGLWRVLPQTIMLAFVPIVAYTVLNHPHYKYVVDAITPLLAGAETDAIRSQLKAPLVLQQLLPTGLLGVFLALMLCATITTFDTYLHSWGSILVQDVIIPIRRRPLETRAHLTALRLAILFVAVFIFCFSLVFKQTQYIFLFFAITGAIFAGGSGAVIIGGLYWKRGTARAAWAAMTTGSAIAVGGIILKQVSPSFPVNGQEFWAIAMLASSIVFVLVSLLGGRQTHDLDRLLRRGVYADKEESAATRDGGVRGAEASRSMPGTMEGSESTGGPESDARVFGRLARRTRRAISFGPEFTRGDRIIYLANYVWTIGWFLVFLIGTVINLTREVSDGSWMRFWRVFVWIYVAMAIVTAIWFSVGGFLDLRRMLQRLKTRARDHSDDGFVRVVAEEDRELRGTGRSEEPNRG